MDFPVNIWPAQDVAALNAFYGDPNIGGHASPTWEAANLVIVRPPFQMYYGDAPTSGLRVHHKIAAALATVLQGIAATFTPAELSQYQLNKTGGGYCFRMMRGADRPSVHSWGAAVDLAPALNPFGVEYGSRPNMMPMKAVEIFKANGFTWGGLWRIADGMHIQAANV